MATEGFLLVDKPRGWTSHDVVAKVRKLAGMKKVGHAGTLDPMATGLLVLGLGRATRLLRFVQQQPKEYVATARFGVATDTLDADGTETERSPMPVTGAAVSDAMAAFLGDIQQIPPMASAVKIDGRKLYELARRGEDIDRPARPVFVHELEVTAFQPGDFPEVAFRVVCSSGTYVRALADDIARALGGRSHLIALRRVRIGSLDVADAVAMDLLIDDPDRVEAVALSMADGLADLARVTVDEQLRRRISHGSVLSLGDLPIQDTTAVVDESGSLLAVYGPENATARPEVVVA